jgi:uncharacterized membrane protein
MKSIVKLMTLIWQRWRAIWQKSLYPEPVPLPRTRSFWIALGLVTLAALAYIIYFSIFLVTKQNAFQTNGEDLGIMDQAIWSLLHGSMLHQTICNVLTDTNCYGLNGINRFAIHFEPILFPISLLYLLWPDPKALLIFQVLIVASGAFPAFWLARLRLRNTWAALPFALLYLLYPEQQYAVNYDFHPETLTIALLLFALYFLYTRRTVWLFVFAILAMACKEEIPLVVALFGVWSIVLQRRWRSGAALTLLATAWTLVGFFLIPYLFSPTGHPLLITRYAEVGSDPVSIVINTLLHPISTLREHVLEPSHSLYLRKLLAPAGYLPLLTPWILVLAVPTLALNLLSADPNMYSGDFQYNAEIIPILIFASIEATVLIVWIVRWLMGKMNIERKDQEPKLAGRPFSGQSRALSPTWMLQAGVLALVLCYMLVRVLNSTTQYNVYSVMPYAHGFVKPSVTMHDKLASHFIREIPADASVSTQTTLVPHLSQRRSIYLFPYAVDHVDYIFLDATDYTYPFKNYADYAAAVKSILRQGNYGILNMKDGYLLLKRDYPTSDITPAIHMIDDDDGTGS